MKTIKPLMLAAALAGLPLVAAVAQSAAPPVSSNSAYNQQSAPQTQSPQQATPAQGGTANGSGESGGSGK